MDCQIWGQAQTFSFPLVLKEGAPVQGMDAGIDLIELNGQEMRVVFSNGCDNHYTLRGRLDRGASTLNFVGQAVFYNEASPRDLQGAIRETAPFRCRGELL